MKCEINEKLKKYRRIYKNYFQSWKYKNSKDDIQFEMKIPELHLKKLYFFLVEIKTLQIYFMRYQNLLILQVYFIYLN